jgi:hypothetical protein
MEKKKKKKKEPNLITPNMKVKENRDPSIFLATLLGLELIVKI